MGDAASDYLASQNKAKQNIQVGGVIGSSVATAAVGSIASSLAASGGTVLGLTSATLSAAVPFIGPALMGATLLVQYLVANSGCGITCIETSQWANQAAAALQQNLDAYFALPAPRTQTQKALAVANYQTIWNQLQAACGQPGTGDAGVRCISDRQRGACTWRQKYQPQYPGQPALGACFDWPSAYLDPIQQDSVVSDSAGVASSLSALGGSNLLPLALVGGLVALAVWV